jgi:hypothetical protein
MLYYGLLIAASLASYAAYRNTVIGLGLIIIYVAALGPTFGASGHVQVAPLDIIVASTTLGGFFRLPRKGLRVRPAIGVTLLIAAGVFSLGTYYNGWQSSASDLLLVLYAIAAVVIGASLVADPTKFRSSLVSIFLIAASLAALKTIAVAQLAGTVSGPASALQVWNYPTDAGWRTILIGGDTILLVAPLVLGSLATWSGRIRVIAFLASVLALYAVGLSKTRTEIILTVLGLLTGQVLAYRRRTLRESNVAPWIAAGLIILLALITALLASRSVETAIRSSTERFSIQGTASSQDSLAIRQAESDIALSTLSPAQYVAGRGFGANFPDINTNLPTTFAHNGFVWIFLRTGALGIVLVALFLSGLVRAALKSRRMHSEMSKLNLTACATGALALLAVSSITINRFATPEGMFLCGLFVSVLMAPSERRTRREPRSLEHA